MSDDRMDRAERIRNMREGDRGTEDESADADDSADETETAAEESSGKTETAPADSSTSADSGGAADDSGFSSLTTGDGESAAAGASTGADSSPAAASDRTTGSGGGDPSEGTTADDPGEAAAAAQRAAASAAEVMGTDTDQGAPTDPAEAAAGATTVPGDITGVELPDQQLLEEAMSTSSIESTEGGARAAAMEGETTQSEEVVRVLEFALGEEYYCLDIEYVEEIVKRETVTRVPNTPAFVDGVVDLRGQITTILEPKEMMDIESEGDQNLIIVFDPEQFEDQGAIGWVVDEVRQVVPVTESEVNTPPVDAEYINGVVDRDEYDQFVIWIEPEDALAQATTTEAE